MNEFEPPDTPELDTDGEGYVDDFKLRAEQHDKIIKQFENENPELKDSEKPADRTFRPEGELYDDYIKRVVGDKGEAVWHEWNDHEKILFLSETVNQLSVGLGMLSQQTELLIKANNELVVRVHKLETNRFGVPRNPPPKKH